MAFDIGPRIGIEGEAEFRQAINALNTSFKTLGTEMSAVTSAFDKNDKSSRALTAQNGVLNKQIDTQKEKLVQLNSGLAQSTARYGENDRVTQGWQQAVNRANAELNNLERTLGNNARSIALQNSNWTRLGETLSSVGTKMKTVGEGMKSAGEKMSMGLTAPIVGAGVAAAKLASDLNESMNKVEVAFGKNSAGVKTWSDTTLISFGIAKGTALDMVSNYGDMATSMGLPTDSAAVMSEKLVGLAGDLASFKNIGIGEANTALSSIFTGETESLKQLGIVMTQANLQDFAASKGIKTKIADMTQAEQTQLRYNYVMSVTNNAQGDFIRTGAGTANQARIFGETIKELGANMGSYLLPVVTPVIAKLSEMAKGFGDLGEGTKKTILVVAGVAAVIGPVLVVTGSLITAFGTVAGALGIASTAAGVASVATAGVGTAVAGTAASAGAAALLLNPVTLAIAAVGLAAVGVGIALNQKVIPAIDLFGGQVSATTQKTVTAYMDLNTKVGVSLLSFQANNTIITKAIATDMTTTFEKMGVDIKAGRDKHYTEDLATLTKFYTDQGLINSVDAKDVLSKMQVNHTSEGAELTKYEAQIKLIMDTAANDHRTLTQKEVDDIKAIKAKMQTEAITALSASETEQKVIMEKAKLEKTNIATLEASEVIKQSASQRDKTIAAANAQKQGVVDAIARQRAEGVPISDDEARKTIAAAETKRAGAVKKAQDMHAAVVGELGRENADVLSKVNAQNGIIMSGWDNLRVWFANNPIIRWISTQSSAGTADMTVPGNALGTNNFQGGLTTMHERGYEVYSLPSGSKIYNHEASEAMITKTAQEVARGVLSGMQSGGIVQNLVINSPTPLTPSETARLNRNAMRELALNF
jgi:hypothetical protein